MPKVCFEKVKNGHYALRFCGDSLTPESDDDEGSG